MKQKLLNLWRFLSGGPEIIVMKRRDGYLKGCSGVAIVENESGEVRAVERNIIKAEERQNLEFSVRTTHLRWVSVVCNPYSKHLKQSLPEHQQ